jgi:hypothetical protein
LRGVLHLRAIFLVPLGTLWGIAVLGEVDESTTPHSDSLNTSLYLLVLALVATAVIAVAVLYFVMRRRRRTLLLEVQKTPDKDMLRTDLYG